MNGATLLRQTAYFVCPITIIGLLYFNSNVMGNILMGLVWDVYVKDSLKLSTRANRGIGTRKLLSSHAKLPGNWTNFLRNDNNKDELFQFEGQECLSKDT